MHHKFYRKNYKKKIQFPSKLEKNSTYDVYTLESKYPQIIIFYYLPNYLLSIVIAKVKRGRRGKKKKKSKKEFEKDGEGGGQFPNYHRVHACVLIRRNRCYGNA